MKFCLASVVCSLIVAASAIPLSSPTSTASVAVSTNSEKRQGLLKGALGALKHTLRGAPELEKAADGLLLSIDEVPTSTAFTEVPADVEKRQHGSGPLGELEGGLDNVLTGGSQAYKAVGGLLGGLSGGLGRRAQPSRDMEAIPTTAEQLQENSGSSVDLSPRAPAVVPATQVASDVDEGQGSEFDKDLVDAEVIITTPFHPGYLTKERLAKAKNLNIAATAGIGSDHVDLNATNEKRIATNAEDVFDGPLGSLARRTWDSKLSKRQGQNSGSFIEHAVEDTVELVKAFEEKFGIEIREDETESGPEKRQCDLEQAAGLEATTANGVVKRKGPALKSRDKCDASVLSIEKRDPDFESFNPVPRSESPNREAHLVALINVKCDPGSSKPLELTLDPRGEKRQLLRYFNITIELDKEYLPLSFEVNHPTPERRALSPNDLDGHSVDDTGLYIAKRDLESISSNPVPTVESTKREDPSTLPGGGLDYYDVSLVDGFNVPDSFTGGVLDTEGAFKIGASVPRAVEANEANSGLGKLVQYIQYGGVALEKAGEDLTGGLVPVA